MAPYSNRSLCYIKTDQPILAVKVIYLSVLLFVWRRACQLPSFLSVEPLKLLALLAFDGFLFITKAVVCSYCFLCSDQHVKHWSLLYFPWLAYSYCITRHTRNKLITLTINSQHTHNILTTYSQHTHNILTTYSQHTHNKLTTYSQHTHNTLITHS